MCKINHIYYLATVSFDSSARIPTTYYKYFYKMAKMLSNEDLEYISSYTAISKDEVKEQFENFLKENPKGKMTKNHFKHFWKKCFPDVECGELIEHVFRMCDMDNNAKIGMYKK